MLCCTVIIEGVNKVWVINREPIFVYACVLPEISLLFLP